MPSIDPLGYQILCVINDHGPCWKQRVHNYLTDAGYQRTVQTVGYHIDALVADNLLEPIITTPAEAPRDLIIAYRLTDRGATILSDYTSEN